MSVLRFIGWAQCHSRNVPLHQPDHEPIWLVPLEEFSDVYLKRQKLQQGRSVVVEALRRLGLTDVPVFAAKWVTLR